MDKTEAAPLGGALWDALPEAIRERRYPRAYALLRRAGALGRWDAGECLAEALGGTERLFERLLEISPAAETAFEIDLPMPGEAGRTANVCGTLVTLAAAAGEARKLRLLLERGFDPGGASFGAYEAIQCESWRVNRSLFETEWGNPCLSWSEGNGCAFSLICWFSGEKHTLPGLTPLAAAVFFGREDCVRLLLRCPGLSREGEALGSAALLAARGTEAQRACVRLVFGLSPDTEDLAEALCAEGRIPAASVLRFGTLKELRRRLRCPDQTEAALLALLRREDLWLGEESVEPEKLCALVSRRPGLGRYREAQTLLLRSWNSALPGKEPEATLALWKRRCGEKRDITESLESLCWNYSLPVLKQRLALLAEGGTLYAAAEAVSGDWSEAKLGLLLRQVRFYRCSRRGISALACSILDMRSLRLLRSAIRRGALAGEERGALLEYARRQELSAAIRAAILAMPEQPQAETGPVPEGTWSYWSGRNPEEGRFWASGATEEALGERLTEYYHDASHVRRSFLRMENLSEVIGGVEADELYSAALCAESPTLLRALRKSFDYRRVRRFSASCWNEETVRVRFPDLRMQFSGSPLCLAAFCGRCGQLRTLLEAGEDPDDRRRGLRSVLSLHEFMDFDEMLVTPLALALWQGQGEAAALLEAAGADRALAEEICGRIRAFQEKDQQSREEIE